MRSTFAAALAATLAAKQVAGHATFQQLWVDGTDYIRLPSLSWLIATHGSWLVVADRVVA